MTEERPVAIDLDGALGDTRPLWLEWIRSAGPLLGFDAESLPEDRAAAASELDRGGAGNWRVLLERFSEERAPLYLRRDPAASSALRTLESSGRRIGVFTDAPEPLARVALAQLGADRRVAVLETGVGAMERVLERLGADAMVVRKHAELLEAAT